MPELVSFTEARFRVPGGRVRHRLRLPLPVRDQWTLSLCGAVGAWLQGRFGWQETEAGRACPECEAKAAREEGSEG